MDSSTSTIFTYSNHTQERLIYHPPYMSLWSRIVVTFIVILFILAMFVFTLRIYEKWFRRESANSVARSQLIQRYYEHNNIHINGTANYIIPGLDKILINSLPVFTYNIQAPMITDDEELGSTCTIIHDQCVVCLCEFQEGEKGRLLPRCDHRFHTECIDMWFHSHSTCPLCRTPVVV